MIVSVSLLQSDLKMCAEKSHQYRSIYSFSQPEIVSLSAIWKQ